jgi:hypothetical protein
LKADSEELALIVKVYEKCSEIKSKEITALI